MVAQIQQLLAASISGRYVINECLPRMGQDPSADTIKQCYTECLENLFGRTGLSLARLEYSFDDEAAPKTLSLALVSSEIDGPYKNKSSTGMTEYRGSELNFGPFEEGRRQLMTTLPGYKPNKWIDKRMAEISSALTFKPDIICLPEFAFPPPMAEKNEEGYVERQHYGRSFYAFEQRLKDVISDSNEELKVRRKPFIVAGSYHCPNDYYNIAVIFPQGDEQQIDVKVRRFDHMQELGVDDASGSGKPEREQKFITTPILHRKRYPARRVGEICRVPSEISFYTYEVKKIKIAVLICSDIVDLNQFMHLVTINMAKTAKFPVDLILVPAYNLSEIHKSMCRELSYMSVCTVAFVNANGNLPGVFPSTDLYCCGYDLATLPAECAVVESRGKVLAVKLDLTKINNLRQSFRQALARGAPSARIEWII